MSGNKTFWILIFFAFNANATIFPTSQGAVSLGLGNISGFISDPFSAYNHQGSLAFAKQNSISFGFQSQYFVDGLNHACFAANHKLNKTQNLGVGYSFFGNRSYNEGLLKIALSKKFSSQFGGGISLDYLRLQLPKENYSVKNLLTFEAAIYTSFNSNFDFAFQAINPARVPLASYDDERLPFTTNSSLFYNPNKILTIVAEWNQIMNGKGNLKVGLNYQISKKLIIRAGGFNKPINPCLGISYVSRNLQIHLAFAIHPYLNSMSAGGFTFLPKYAKTSSL